MAARKACGRIQNKQPSLPPPAETRRLRDASLAGMRPPEWATELGRLYLTDRITSLQFSAGLRWAALVAAFAEACQSPRPPGSPRLDPSGGTAPDPDSLAGRLIARRHAATVGHFTEASAALMHAGSLAERVTRDVAESELAPAGLVELQALQNGLQHLAAFWAETRRR